MLAITLAGAGFLVAIGAYLSPQVTKLAQIYALRKRCRDTRTLVLTYDDGPGDELTPALLELLAAAEARVTFFPTGRSATRNPELLTRVAAAGHEIGCHSQEHLHAWRTTPWRIVRDTDTGYQTLAPWVPPSGLYRPPCGKASLATWWVVRRRRAAFAWWTVDSGDTHAVLPTPESVVEQVRRDGGGGVVLMHDFDRDPATRAVRHAHVLRTTGLLLDHARRTGWQVRRLGDVLRSMTEVEGAPTHLHQEATIR